MGTSSVTSLLKPTPWRGSLLFEDVHHFSTRESFHPLLLLALNACGITTWSTLLTLDTFAPNLQELYLAANNFENIETFAPLGQSSPVTHLSLTR
jgi:hypothetical protein